MKKKKLDSSGFTLVEIIIGIAILGVLCISIVPLFEACHLQVIRSSNRSKATYTAQADAETVMSGNTAPNTTTASQTLSITINGVNINVPGNESTINEPVDSHGNTTNLVIFKPN